MRGGKRTGSGRPKAPASGVIRLRLPLPVFEAVQDRGGAVWAKRVIVEAVEQLKGK